MKRILTFLAILLISSPAFAADQWSDPAPGIRHLYRTAPGPLKIHAAVIDFSRSDLYLRVTRPEERGRTVTGFAQSVGAVAAINGDWFESGYQPVGLAVGDGAYWEGSDDVGWSFMACTLEKECFFDNHPENRELNWRWHNVVGGNGWRLVIDGNIPQYPADAFYTARHPRSAVGLSADGKTMIFMVIEGRRGDSVGAGFRTTAEQMKSLGAHQAMMLDGGGSSALAINGGRVSGLPNGAGERVVANHVAIVRGSRDARCDATPNGRYCDGSVINTCMGGQHFGNGDCAAFGASCEVAQGNVGVCSHYLCGQNPDGAFCEDESKINTCQFGRPAPQAGDCAAFGATCETEAAESRCVSVFCPQGADAVWCDGNLLSTCAEGVPSGEPVDCAATGQVCDPMTLTCVTAPDPAENPAKDPVDEVTENDKSPAQNVPDGQDDPEDQTQVIDSNTGTCSQSTAPSSPQFFLLFAIITVFIRRRRHDQ